MSLFLVIFLSVYALMHSVVFWGVYPLLRARRAVVIGFIILFAAMLFTPIFVRIMEHKGFEQIARIAAWVGFSWLGFVFIGFSAFLLLLLWETAANIIAMLRRGKKLLSIHGKCSAITITALTVAIGCYGFWEAANIKVVRVVIETDKLSSEDGKITVAQVSDIHLGLMLAEGKLRKIVRILEQENPDIIVSTGDMVDAQIDHIDLIAHIWRELEPPLGKFAVLGNHEFYGHLNYSLDFHKDSGFKVLRQHGVVVGGRINIAGVDDPVGGFANDELEVLQRLDRDKFTILLKHRPVVEDQSSDFFDLQLSGHSHNGQIFPFTLITALEYPMQRGLHRLDSGAMLYTNPGTGTWGPPMRVASKPEITIFEIVPK